MMYMPLPEGADVTAKSLEHFLQSLLADNCDRIWYCPFITGFIDEQTPSKMKVIQVANITKQVSSSCKTVIVSSQETIFPCNYIRKRPPMKFRTYSPDEPNSSLHDS